jgi:hypothetical protein
MKYQELLDGLLVELILKEILEMKVQLEDL